MSPPGVQSSQDFIESRITRADTMVVSYAVQKVVSGDVIMTFAYSHVVYQVGCVALAFYATQGQCSNLPRGSSAVLPL